MKRIFERLIKSIMVVFICFKCIFVLSYKSITKSKAYNQLKFEISKFIDITDMIKFDNKENKELAFLDNDFNINLDTNYPDYGIPGGCFFINPYTYDVYYFKKLHTKENDREFRVKNGKIKFNFCSNLINKCDDKVGQLAYYSNKDTNKCNLISGDIKNFNYLTFNNDSKSNYVNMYMNTNIENNNISVVFKLICSKNLDVGDLYILSNPENLDFESEGIITIEAESYHACSQYNYYYFSRAIKNNKILVTVIFIILGLIICFVGIHFVYIMLSVLASIFFIILLSVIYLILASIFNFAGNLTTVVVIIVVGIALGVGLVLCVKGIIRIIFMFLGLLTGYLAGHFIYNFFGFSRIHSNPLIVYWSIIIVLCIVGLYLGSKFLKLAYILSSAMLGSYLIIRSLSYLIGGFPSEYIMIDLLRKEEYKEFNSIMSGVVYTYLAGWIIIFLASAVYQISKSKNSNDEDFLGKDN